MTEQDAIREAKARIRAEARTRRQSLADRAERSDRIARRIEALPEYAAAGAVLFYVALRDEVATEPLIRRAIQANKRVIVPYCAGRDLRLFRLERLDELSPGTYGVLEPRPALRAAADRIVEPAALDLVLVPGVAFDRQGGRIGQGAGYYDRFLPSVPVGVPRVGVAFECQIWPAIPVSPHDVHMDRLVTESGVFPEPSDEPEEPEGA